MQKDKIDELEKQIKAINVYQKELKENQENQEKKLKEALNNVDDKMQSVNNNIDSVTNSVNNLKKAQEKSINGLKDNIDNKLKEQKEKIDLYENALNKELKSASKINENRIEIDSLRDYIENLRQLVESLNGQNKKWEANKRRDEEQISLLNIKLTEKTRQLQERITVLEDRRLDGLNANLPSSRLK